MGRLQRIISLMILLLLSKILLAQGWQTTWDTGIIPNLGSAIYTDKITAYADNNGIHVLTNGYDGGNFTTKYYLFNFSGSLVRSTDHGTMVSAALTISDNNIYIIYIDNASDQIKGKKSSDAGQTWSSILDQDMEGTQDQEYLTTAADARGIHISHDDDGGAYYRLYDPISNSWTDHGFISSGLKPWVATSTDRAHFVYDKTDYAYARSYNHVTQSWESEQEVAGSIYNIPKSIIVDGTKEYVFYSIFSGMVLPLSEKRRVINSSSWESEVYIGAHSFSGVSPFLTKDGTIHIIYNVSGAEYRYLSNGAWTTEEIISGPNATAYPLELTGIGNDLYALWTEDQTPGGDKTLRIRWKDEAPVAPQNLTQTASSGNPHLVWDANTEPDLQGYHVYRSNFSNFNPNTQLTSTPITGTQYTDSDVIIRNQFWPKFYYRVKAIDNSSLLSNWSNQVWVYGNNGAQKTASSANGEMPKHYNLSQNYPNPFNPETIIRFALPEGGNTTVTIFDISGKEVTRLIDGFMSPGYHSVTWNAGNSASGLYLYRISSGDFVKTMKMAVMK